MKGGSWPLETNSIFNPAGRQPPQGDMASSALLKEAS